MRLALERLRYRDSPVVRTGDRTARPVLAVERATVLLDRNDHPHPLRVQIARNDDPLDGPLHVPRPAQLLGRIAGEIPRAAQAHPEVRAPGHRHGHRDHGNRTLPIGSVSVHVMHHRVRHPLTDPSTRPLTKYRVQEGIHHHHGNHRHDDLGVVQRLRRGLRDPLDLLHREPGEVMLPEHEGLNVGLQRIVPRRVHVNQAVEERVPMPDHREQRDRRDRRHRQRQVDLHQNRGVPRTIDRPPPPRAPWAPV